MLLSMQNVCHTCAVNKYGLHTARDLDEDSWSINFVRSQLSVLYVACINCADISLKTGRARAGMCVLFLTAVLCSIHFSSGQSQGARFDQLAWIAGILKNLYLEICIHCDGSCSQCQTLIVCNCPASD